LKTKYSYFIFILVVPMQQYQQNTVMMQQPNYMQQTQQPPQQQTAHSQMYAQGQMPSGPYMNNQMLGNPAK